MKLVATSDTHFPLKPKLITDGDVLIVAGDIMSSGYADEWLPVIDSIAALPHAHKVLVAGNHDRYIEKHTEKALKDLADRNIKYVGHPVSPLHTLPNGMTMIGLPFVTELPNWAFNKYEFYIDNYLEALPQVDIVVSHSPPYGILDGVHHDRWAHYGVHAYNRFLREKPPKLWICGHCHDCYGHDRWKGVDFYNVAHCDEYYNQTNKPLVLEL